MATRMMFDSATTPSISPAFSALWDVTAAAQRRTMGLETTIADNNLISGSSFAETSTSQVDVLGVQFTSIDTIPDTRTIGNGTFSLVFPAYETNAGADGYLQVCLKVMTSANALRGVLYAGNAATTVSTTVGATNEEFTTVAMATRIYSAVGLSPVACQAGDRIVLEVGAHMCNTTATSRGFFLRRGYESADTEYALTSGLTSIALNPWVEFSEDLFDATPPPTGGLFDSLGTGTNLSQCPSGGLITECSGMTISRSHPTHFYAHNDSGDTNRMWLVQLRDGTIDATITLTGATNVDWEDCCYYSSKVWVADIGNNAGTRTNQGLYSFDDVASIADQSVAATHYPITIDSPGTALDCEAFFIRPSDGATFIYVKANATVTSSGLYQGPNVASLSTSSANHFARITNHSLQQVTAGDYSSDGRYYVLNTNGNDPTFTGTGGMYVYDGATHVEIGRFVGNTTTGGARPSECVCWAADDQFVYRSFDGGGTKSNCPIYRYPVNYTTDTGGTLTADAGADLTDVAALSTVALVGTATGGSGTYTYAWTQTGGASVTLSGTGATRTFKAPGTLTGTTLTFQLQVTDSVAATDTDTMTVAILANRAWFAQTTLKPIRLTLGVDQGGGDPLPRIPTIAASTFLGYWGSRIFPWQTGAEDRSLATQSHSWLTNIKPGFVSTKLTPGIVDDAPTIALIQNLAAEGCLTSLTVGEPFTTYSDAEWVKMMNCLKFDLAGCVLMVNGQNEINHVRGGGTLPGNWATQAAEHQKVLWRYMNVGGSISTTYAGTTRSINYGTPVNTVLTGGGHAAVKTGTPSLWSGSIATHNADLLTLAPLVTGFCDAINYHLYPRGVDPTWNLTNFVTRYRAGYGNLPIFCTEAGYFHAANYTGTAAGVTYYAHDIYVRKMWLEYASLGAWVSQFQFMDNVDAGKTLRENNFGMVGADTLAQSGWYAQIAYTHMATMRNAISGGTAGDIGCLIETTGNVQRLAVNHSTGTKLYLWRRDDIEANLVKIPLTPVNVTVTSLAGGVQIVPVSDEVVTVNL